VHGALHAFGTAVESAFEILEAIVERRARLACEQRFVDLYVNATGVRQRQHFDVERARDIGAKPFRIVVKIVVATRNWSRTDTGPLMVGSAAS
jgi:hypothetical protein